MIEYMFICPHCNNESTIVERNQVTRDTDLIGFNYYSGKCQPEFSEFEDTYDDAGWSIYICGTCEAELDVEYSDLLEYIEEHGSIENVKS